jgi:hypothetical protein
MGVAFVDLVGFTPISRSLPPSGLVHNATAMSVTAVCAPDRVG